MPAADKTPSFTFSPGDAIVYPGHGAGRVDSLGVQEVAGMKLEVVSISFPDNKLVLKVPLTKALNNGLRPLMDKATMEKVRAVLKSKPKVSRVMWARRAKEYEDKIKSTSPLVLAEVIRDLGRRRDDGPEGSYSEKIILESAISRMASEWAAVEGVTREEANRQIHAEVAQAKTPAATA